MSVQKDLEYFKGLTAEKRPGGPRHSSEIWNKRADDWDAEMRKEGVMQRVNEIRIREAVEFLGAKGLLKETCDVIDIGCGPGRFVAEFAKTAHHVTGTDYSTRMLEYGAQYAKEQGLTNVSFTACDFKQADVKKMGWEKKFDLVFSSMTPAMGAPDSVEKMIQMSRGYCCNVSCAIKQSRLDQQIAHELNLGIAHSRWDGLGFYTLFNLVWLMGYFPELKYYPIAYTEEYTVSPELAQIKAMEICRDETAAHADEVYRWLLEHAKEGVIEDPTENWYGFVLWDTRLKLPRW